MLKRSTGAGASLIAKVKEHKMSTEGPAKSTGYVVQDEMLAKHRHDVAVTYLANNSSNLQSLDKYTGYDPALHAYSQEYYTGYDAFPPTFNRQYSPQCHFNRYTGVQSVQHYFHPMAYPSHQQTSDYSSQYMQTIPMSTESHGYYGQQSYSYQFMKQQGTHVGVNVSQQINDYSSQYVPTRPTSTESHDNQTFSPQQGKREVAANPNEQSNTDGYGDNLSFCDADAESLAEESEDITKAQPSENVTPSPPSENLTAPQASCVTGNLNILESAKQTVPAKGERNQGNLKRKYEIKTKTYELHSQKNVRYKILHKMLGVIIIYRILLQNSKMML